MEKLKIETVRQLDSLTGGSPKHFHPRIKSLSVRSAIRTRELSNALDTFTALESLDLDGSYSVAGSYTMAATSLSFQMSGVSIADAVTVDAAGFRVASVTISEAEPTRVAARVAARVGTLRHFVAHSVWLSHESRSVDGEVQRAYFSVASVVNQMTGNQLEHIDMGSLAIFAQSSFPTLKTLEIDKTSSTTLFSVHPTQIANVFRDFTALLLETDIVHGEGSLTAADVQGHIGENVKVVVTGKKKSRGEFGNAVWKAMMT